MKRLELVIQRVQSIMNVYAVCKKGNIAHSPLNINILFIDIRTYHLSLLYFAYFLESLKKRMWIAYH